MRLFKTQHQENLQQAASPVPDIEKQETSEAGRNVEEIARQWWAKHLGGTIPQDIENWMQQLTRTEARRLTLESALLSEKQMERASEAYRLCSTHMQHIGEQIQRVRRQREWLHNFQRMNLAREQHANALYEANKLLSININDEKRLERFETFEPIQGEYQHLRLLTAMSQQQRDELSAVQEQLVQAHALTEDKQKQADQQRNRLIEMEKQMEQANDQVEQMCRILGERTVLDLVLRDAALHAEQLNQQQIRLTRTSDDLKAQMEQIEAQLSVLRTKWQSLEPHRTMIHRGREIVLRLKLMAEARHEMKATNAKMDDVRQKLREENKTLSNLFQDFQRLEGELNELSGELQQHRASIAGSTSYQLQERAMHEQTRHEILLSAQATWKLICAGYQQIDNLKQEITQLSHQLKYGLDTQRQLESEVACLEEHTHDMERTLTLSKSQSVIELRSDLREGISCTVCGAVHHPYHSDTMLEQNKLIDDIRIEYNQLNQEYTAKARTLEQLCLDNAGRQAAKEQKQQFLDYVKAHQQILVEQWKMYADLDVSFADCSESTNQDARTEMLRLLIGNALRQSEEAQRELGTHNFHQAEINKLTEQIAQKEQEKSNLITHLSEVNTGCHVLSRQVELLEEMHSEELKHYTTHYEEAEKTIMLHEWVKQWEMDSESLCLRINDMMEQWKNTRDDIARLETQRSQCQALLQNISETQKFVESNIQDSLTGTEKLMLMRGEGQKRYDQLMEVYREENFHKTRYQELKQNYVRMETANRELHKAALNMERVEGRNQELTRNNKDVDRQLAQIRYNLDLWISRFNANHPPVQYEELESVLDGTTDWTAVRQHIRQTHVEADTRQRLVQYLENEILEMQAIASKSSTNIHELTEQSLDEEMRQLGDEYYREAIATARQQLLLERDREMRQSMMHEQQALQEFSAK